MYTLHPNIVCAINSNLAGFKVILRSFKKDINQMKW